jgi:hypothetical protein
MKRSRAANRVIQTFGRRRLIIAPNTAANVSAMLRPISTIPGKNAQEGMSLPTRDRLRILAD